MGQLELDRLLEYFRDRYEPTELIDHIDISIDELLTCLEDYIKENLEQFQEDLENLTHFEDED